MSIADYSELLIEAAERADAPDLPQRGQMLVGMLETYLNKKLRTVDQEASTTVTADANGDASLPTDRVEIKGVFYDDVRVPRRTFSHVEVDFTGWGWYSEGDTLKSNLEGHDLEIRYFEEIPNLHTNGTSWLLTAEPEIYLAGLMWQVHLRKSDYEQAALSKGYLDNLIAEFSLQDRRKRRNLTKVDMGGKHYERGNDFTITPV